ERNLLSVAYKNIIGAHRSSHRLITSISEKQQQVGNEDYVQALEDYKAKVEQDIMTTCKEVFRTLDEDIIPFVEEKDKDENLVFYYKIKADYYRYLAEINNANAAEDAKTWYNKGTEVAQNLVPGNPIRLGLALNVSVFYFEI
ncbi:hypothetical protein BX616_009059, partial [Lobosporangium transversale]